MSNISVDYDILNQKQTPAFYASSLATRPAFGFPGRIFIDTDTPSSGIYRDTGSAWVQVADPGAGTTGTLQQVTTNGNTTTLGVTIQGIDINDGAGTGANNMAIGTSALANNTTGISNTAIGYVSLNSNTTGGGNVGVGFNALQFNTTGGDNTGIGSYSLKANTTGNFNSALGVSSLQNNTTGNHNTGLGQGALALNTTASFNTAVGSASLSANTTGANNVAIGYQSLNANTTASFNTAIGFSTLKLNSTGSNNTAVGYNSLLNNTIGVDNTAIGTNALLTNSNGGSNTAIGLGTLFTNSTGNSNTAIGKNALNNNTTASNNTAIGINSLSANTTGTSNTAVGSSALTSNTTGGNNTAIGLNSLALNTTGTQNTAVGISSLYANTTANYNTAIGVSALTSNTTGDSNTAVGQSALQTNTTGANNVAIGYGALISNTTASNNTAIGNTSLEQNTTGVNNTAIGSSSLKANTTGQNNTAIGTSSLIANTTGTQNTAIGSSALNLNTTGQLNTTIGYNSGSAITTGSNNTIIGAYAGTSTLASNIVLSDGAGNVRLFSDANGLIGIGQAVGTPGGQLDIHTTQTYALVLNGLSTNNAYIAFSNASVGQWRIGNLYSAGANAFNIFNLGTSSASLSINKTTNVATFISSVTATGFTATGSGYSTFFGLRVSGNDTGNTIYNGASNIGITCDSGTRIFLGQAGSSTIGINVISSTGALLVGSATDDTTNKLQVTGSIKATGNITTDAIFAGRQTNGQAFSCGNGIDSDLGILVQTNNIAFSNTGTSTGYTFVIGGTTRVSFLGTGVVNIANLAGTGSRAVLADASGNLSAPVSDISVKENINTIGYGLNEILKMNPVWFDYIDEYKNYGEGRQNGNIAQEMETIIPEAVFTTPTTGKMGINYDQLHAVYIKAIQELNEKLIRNNIN